MEKPKELGLYLDLGAFLATAVAVCATWVWNSPSLNAEIVVLLSALIAAAYCGIRGSLIILAIYVIPVSVLFARTGASTSEWLVLSAKLAFIISCAYVVSRVSKYVWVRMRRDKVQLGLLRRELRRLRHVKFASEEIAQQIGTNEVITHTVERAITMLRAQGAGAWLASDNSLIPLLVKDWPERVSEADLLKGFEGTNPYFYTRGFNVVWTSFHMGAGQTGILAVALNGPRKRFRAAVRSLSSLVRGTAAAVSRTQVLESHRKQADYLGLLNELGHKFATNLGLEDLFISLYREVRRVMDAEAFFVALYDSSKEEVDLRYIFDDGVRVDSFTYMLNDGPTSRAIKTKAPVLHNVDGRLVPGVTVLGDEAKIVQSLIVVPIVLQERVIGALSAQSYKSNAYTDEHVGLLSIIASQAAIAIDNAQLYEHTLRMALTDSMTGLANARALHSALDEGIQDAMLRSTEMSLIMVDSDSLKRINDSFGHNAGDELICHLADVVRDNVRVGDTVGRYGGDEFVVLLPNTNAQDARVVAHRIIQAVRNKDYNFGQQQVRVTASAGVATYPHDASNAESLIRAADAAMYRAKHAGKDQVVCTGDADISKSAGQ